MDITVFYVSACPTPNEEMGYLRSTPARSIGHARAIIAHLYSKGIDNAWVLENGEYKLGYIRTDEGTVYDN